MFITKQMKMVSLETIIVLVIFIFMYGNKFKHLFDGKYFLSNILF